MIEADFAEFVDDDDSTGERRIAQQGVQESGLAGPKKTGDDGQRKGAGGLFCRGVTGGGTARKT